MYGSSYCGNKGSLYAFSFELFELNVYLCDQAASLDPRRYQKMYGCGDSHPVYDAKHGASCDTRVGA